MCGIAGVIGSSFLPVFPSECTAEPSFAPAHNEPTDTSN
jgi:hypothetical protein